VRPKIWLLYFKGLRNIFTKYIVIYLNYRLNERILRSDGAEYLDLTGEALTTLKLETFASMNKVDRAATFAKNIKG